MCPREASTCDLNHIYLNSYPMTFICLELDSKQTQDSSLIKS